MGEKNERQLTKLGLLIKGILNLLLFGLFLLFIPVKYFSWLGLTDFPPLFLKLVGISASFLGTIYIKAALQPKRFKIIARITYLDALIYPIVILLLGIFLKLPWSIWLSALLVGIAAILLIIGKGHKHLFK